ncbi:hypothetical protein EXE59_02655 [Nocardioides eburneiflavus]|uniref:DUF222 domain-containing protein n=1 Tax=Nocardioides eburneiflavus TaxID=2518372 RepID=A0A4Z1CM03_9ACTN|nr:hypothetical protein [Nocardioides eburneiflavus]TGN62969.1 hypothetical protein EXE59_02655 [Nocardioides eburneiflavus]
MIDGRAAPARGVTDDLSPADLLATIKASRDLENTEAARQLDLAARWADLHPPESIHDAASFTVPGSQHEEPIAGEGAPLVAEFCCAELGTVLGITVDRGEEAHRSRPRAAPPPAAVVGAGPRRCGARLAGEARRGHHDPLLARVDS